jgi:hypothetical protein
MVDCVAPLVLVEEDNNKGDGWEKAARDTLPVPGALTASRDWCRRACRRKPGAYPNVEAFYACVDDCLTW